MRPIVPPPPSSRCQCGGELRLKRIEPAYEILGKQSDIFVCTRCGLEEKFIVDANPYSAAIPHRTQP